MRLRRDSAANRKASSENRKASSENRKVFSEESEGFFRRALGSYTHKFPKRGAASLTYLPRSRLDLPHSRLGLPRLRSSRNSGQATEGFSNHGINFKDAYRSKSDGVLCFHYSHMRIANDTEWYAPHTNVPMPPALCLSTPVPRQKLAKAFPWWVGFRYWSIASSLTIQIYI